MGMHRTLAFLLLVAAGCSNSPAPGDPQPATIESLRANPALCGPDSPICEARVNHVEGRPVVYLASQVEVSAGRHTLGIFCKLNLGIMIGDAQSFQREVEVVLAPGGRYRVEAGMEPRPCTVALIDEATGTVVGTVR